MSRIFLVVDADAEAAEATRRQLLQVAPDSECLVAGSAMAAMVAMTERRLVPSMLITEFRLPDMNAIEFLGALRRERWLAGLPVAILSNLATDREIVACYRLGLSAFLGKPARLMDLKATLKDFAREAQVLSAAGLVERESGPPHAAAA